MPKSQARDDEGGSLLLGGSWVVISTHRLLSSSFLGLPFRILNVNHKKELVRSLSVGRISRAPMVIAQGGEIYEPQTCNDP